MEEPTRELASTPRGHEVSRFVHAVAHELQNPLSSLTMLLSILRSAGDAMPAPLGDYLEKALGATERMRQMIRSLVDYVDAGTSDRPSADIDCGALLREILAELDDASACRIELDDTGWPIVHGDPIELRRVFQNLLDNALRYRGSDEPVVRVSCRRRGGSWEFRIADNGRGIPADEHDRVFEPLVRLHTYDEVPGSGLGLAIAHKVVERHGGRIGLTSKPGRGTEAWFTWPATDSDRLLLFRAG